VWFEPGPVRVTYGLKQQLKYLAQPPAESGLRGFVVSGPVVDVRVASWMLCSDSTATEEDKWEGKNGRRWVVFMILCHNIWYICFPGYVLHCMLAAKAAKQRAVGFCGFAICG
jgi:hypothetical protein